MRRQLRRLTIPIFMEIALVMLVGFVDVLMLSQYGAAGEGDRAVAAVGFVNQFISLVFLVYQFVSQGMAIVCAQYHGAGERRRLMQIVGLALGLNAAVGLAVSATIFACPEEILRLLRLKEELLPQGVVYLRITGMLSFFQALAFAFSASLRSVDKVKAVMYVTVSANILNAVGNYLLIFGHCGCPELGVAGAAWRRPAAAPCRWSSSRASISAPTSARSRRTCSVRSRGGSCGTSSRSACRRWARRRRTASRSSSSRAS